MRVISKLVCGGLFLWPLLIQAVGSDFAIRALVGDDTIAPTTPTLLSATPVAPTQIDLAWSESTDNYLIGGYVVLRDGNPVATTTLLTYNDTGLLPATSYTYEVYAFDSVFNQSSTSNALSTTTLSLPPPPATNTPEVRTSPRSRVLIATPVQIDLTERAAVFSWQTDRPARYELRWGRYDLSSGYITSEAYAREHRTVITDLEPGTTYNYELIGYTGGGVAVVIGTGSFTTKSSAPDYFVPNVSRLQAEVRGEDVLLSYQLPMGFVPDRVRVVRSPWSYPISINDGALVYEGLNTSVFDRQALTKENRQYYTVFVIDDSGVVSSGAVIMVAKEQVVVDSGTTTLPIITEPTNPYPLPAELISVRQLDQSYSFLADRITLRADEAFAISIPYDALPPHLKSIIVTIIDPTDHRQSYSFLLRLNANRTAYEAVVAPLNVSGESHFMVAVYDFELNLIGRYRVPVSFLRDDHSSAPRVLFPDYYLFILGRLWWWLLGVILLLLFGYWLYRRRN